MDNNIFDPTATYDQARDVRDWTWWKRKLNSQPNGCLFVMVAPRRAGKTWALRALEFTSENSRYIDLKVEGEEEFFSITKDASPILVDEAGSLIRAEPLSFLRKCRDLKRLRQKVFLAASPGEYALLREADPHARFMHDLDVDYLPGLNDAEILKLADGVDWAISLVREVPRDWTYNAHLLTCVLKASGQDANLRHWGLDLKKQATLIASENRSYVYYVLHEGLTVRQRNTLRQSLGQRTTSLPEALQTLKKCGLLAENGGIRDPIIAEHFRPKMIIHHISDVHVGPKSATVVDRKDDTDTGKVLAAAGGRTWIRDEYLAHLQGVARPHLLAVTGDLVEYGGVADQLEDAARWLASVAESISRQSHPDLESDDPRVLVVGGNHDVDWAKSSGDDGALQRHAPFGEKFQPYPHPDLHRSVDERRAPFVHYRSGRISILLLGSAEFGGHLDYRGALKAEGEDWFSYLCRLLDTVDSDADKDRLKKVLVDLGVDLDGVKGRLEVQRVDPGFVSKQSLDRSRALKEEAEPLRIALLHHPLSPLPAAPDIARYAGLTNSGQVKDTLFDLGVHLVLHGHQHRGFFAEERWPGRYAHTVHIAAAPSLGSKERDESNGYNEIRIFREGDALTAVEVRTVRFQGAAWKLSGEDPRDPGVMRFLIPGNDAQAWRIDLEKER